MSNTMLSSGGDGSRSFLAQQAQALSLLRDYRQSLELEELASEHERALSSLKSQHSSFEEGFERAQEQLDIVRSLEEKERLEEMERAHEEATEQERTRTAAIMGEQKARIAHLEEKVRALEKNRDFVKVKHAQQLYILRKTGGKS